MKQNKLMTEQGMKKFEESFWAAIQESAQEIKANGNKGKDKWTRIIASPLFCAVALLWFSVCTVSSVIGLSSSFPCSFKEMKTCGGFLTGFEPFWTK